MTNEDFVDIKKSINIDDLYNFLDEFVNLLHKEFSINRGFIYFFNKLDERYDIIKIFGMPHSSLNGFRIRESVTFLNICRKNDYINLNDEFFSIFPEFERLGNLNLKWIYILKIDEKIYGGLVIGDNKKENFDSLNFFLRKNRVYICLLIENLFYIGALKRMKWEKQIELEVGRKLSGTMDNNYALNYMIDKIKEVVDYDAAGIFLIQGESDKIEYQILKGYDEKALEKVDLKLGTGLVGWCAKTGRGMIVADVRKNQRYIKARYQTRSQIVIPLYVGGIVKGVLNLESDRIGCYTKEHYDYLETIANITGIFIENFRLNYEFIRKKELENELQIAKGIQKALLPKKMPKLSRYKFSRYFKPSKEVGGDLYEVSRFPNNKLGIAIGDISGKGIPAAILMASFYSIFKSRIKENEMPDKIVTYLNKEFYRVVEVGNYSTFFYGVLELKNNRAGHNPPILVSVTGNSRFLREGGIVLGFIRDYKYKLKQIDLSIGDVIVFYTDGITEMKNKNDEEFGEERLRNLVIKHKAKNPYRIRDAIKKELTSFNDGNNEDDKTLIVLKRIE